MTQKDASRIQSTTARKGDGGVKKGSFASRAQRAAALNDNKRSVKQANPDDTEAGVGVVGVLLGAALLGVGTFLYNKYKNED